MSVYILNIGLARAVYIRRVGQNHIYTVYVRYFWQGNHQKYGHIRCIYTVLANPINTVCIYGFFCSDLIKYTVIYGVYIRFWPTLINFGHKTLRAFHAQQYNGSLWLHVRTVHTCKTVLLLVHRV
jgi:hypothetical protein